jgi:membrane protease subunit HflC
MRSLLWLAAAALALLAIATSTVVVDEREHVVITQFGRPTAVHSQAGLHWKLPAPIQRATRFDKRVLFTDARETEFLTADKKNVMVAGYLSWRITDPLLYLAALRTREFAESRLVALVLSELGAALGELPFTALVPASEGSDGLARLEGDVQAAAREVARRDFGIEIVSFGVTRLGYPAQNLQSVFARMRAERERIARGQRSEGAAEAQKIRAEADRERTELLARAEAEAARLRGEGEAEAARIYAEAYGGHEAFYRFLRTLESYEKVLGEKTTLVLPADSPFLEILMSRPGGRDGS